MKTKDNLEIVVIVCFACVSIMVIAIVTKIAILSIKADIAVKDNYNIHVTNVQLLTTELELLRSENERLKEEIDSLTKQQVEQTESTNISSSDFELVCRVVAAEARGESFRGQQAVAQVIRDRYISGYYGDTISDVVYAPYQFAAPWTGNLDEYPEIAEAVTTVFDGHNIFDGTAIYFFNPDTSKETAVASIREASTYFGVVGRHEFRGWTNE